MRTLAGELCAGVAAAVVARRLSRAGVQATQSGRARRWTRTNHAGEQVTLLAGPAVLAGLAGGGALRWLLRPRPGQRRATVAAGVAGLGSGLVGGYDDLYGNTQAKGFGGHLRALRRGELTSGMIKIAGVGASAVVAAVIISGGRPARALPLRVADVAVDTVVVAGLANLVNLFDLRPGRAGKVSALVGLLGLAHGSSVVLGAVAGELPDDLAGRTMLGDTGANALGAALGCAVAGRSRPVRLLTLGAVLALTAASERVSFTAVIERTPWLRALDQLGRAG